MGVRFTHALGALALTPVLALTACGSSKGGGFHPSGTVNSAPPASGQTLPTGSAPPPGTTTNPPTPLPAPSTMTTPQLKSTVLDAYRAYMAAYESASETNDPSRLTPYAIDPLLSRVTADLQAQAKAGIIWRFHNVLNPQIQGQTPDRTKVIVLDCVKYLGGYEYSVKSGERISARGQSTNYFQVEMTYVDSVWKATQDKVGGVC